MVRPKFQRIACGLLAIAGCFGLARAGRGERPPEEAASLAARLQWVQFQVQQGRITATQPRYGSARSRTVEDAARGVRESYTVSVREGVASVHYERTDPRQRLIVDVADGNQVRLDWESRGQLRPGAISSFSFLQPASGAVRMIVRRGGRRIEYSAPGLWRLLLEAPESCGEQLAPVLEKLRPNWRLLEQARRIEAALTDADVVPSGVSGRRLRQLVEQLGSRDFRKRQAADRSLRSIGQPVVSFFDQLDLSRLDSEQRLRIRRIRQSLSLPTEDAPIRVAARLVEDASLWLAWLEVRNPAERERAARHLERIWGRKLPFDPRADPATRRAQIARLRTGSIR